MIGKVLGLFFTLLVFQNVQCQVTPLDPPTVEGSFIAWGEIVQPVDGTEDLITIQSSFEECYDADTQNSAFSMSLYGKNMTFVKSVKTNQTFLYTENDRHQMVCMEVGENEWMSTGIGPGLLSFEGDDGTVKFSLTQLLNIPKKLIMQGRQPAAVTYRGMPANSWTYDIRINKKDDDKYDHSLSITAYWSDGSWNTTAGRKVIPLGFNVSRITWSEPVFVEDYVLSVFGFVPDAYDHKFFQPYQGIVCDSRKSTLKFPDVGNYKAISLHSEMALANDQEIRYIDTWFDPVNELIRVDVERMKNENPLERKNKHYQSEISIEKMGAVFRWGYYKGESSCEVIPFDKYENDFQNFFDVTQKVKRWQMGRLFGLNDTSYVYIGKTTKNDIPCHMFQGKRTDWPDKKSNITSLWEWCFNFNMSNTNDIVLFQDDEFGLISADVTILSHPNPNWNNYKLLHHFYEVQLQDPKVLDATSFDLGRCFPDNQKRLLQFYINVDIGEDNRDIYENATSDIYFLQKWKAEIYRNSGLSEFSLRVSNVWATIDNHKLYIKFTILPVHKDLPEDAKKRELPPFDAETNLRGRINQGLVFILHTFDKSTSKKLIAVKHSVSQQIDPSFNPQTIAPPPPITDKETTPFVFTLRTKSPKETTGTGTSSDGSVSITSAITDGPTDASSPSSKFDWRTTPPTDPEEKVKKIPKGHGPGSVAGVSIAMLLVGITIGSFGTFYKFNGLPACLKT